jgi:hypothetical protein
MVVSNSLAISIRSKKDASDPFGAGAPKVLVHPLDVYFGAIPSAISAQKLDACILLHRPVLLSEEVLILNGSYLYGR